MPLYALHAIMYFQRTALSIETCASQRCGAVRMQTIYLSHRLCNTCMEQTGRQILPRWGPQDLAYTLALMGATL